MRYTPESLSTSARVLHDTGMLAILALVVVPLYLMLNHYWQSLVLLVVFYGLLGLFCVRMGEHTRRVMRRLPAEIPPWQESLLAAPAVPGFERHFSTADALQSVRKDPHYVQEVLKPRLRQLVVYRVSGSPDMSLQELDEAHLATLDPVLLQFLWSREDTGLWARYGQRQRRIDAVLDMLRRVERL